VVNLRADDGPRCDAYAGSMRRTPWWQRRVGVPLVDVAIAAVMVSIACLVGTAYFPHR
jgi:hypothetical protein